MSEEYGLRQAVLRQPDDDLPRLVYADWLEDQGEGPRAEFIRGQVQLAATPPWEPFAVRARHHRPLDAQLWRHTLPPLGSGVMADWHAERPFHRGFGGCVHVRQLGAFLRMAPEIFAVEPVCELVLPAAMRDDWAALAAAPWLARLRRLRFTTGSMLSEPIRALAASPHTRLESIAFDVSTSPGMAAVVEILVQSPLAGQLKELEFRIGHDRDGDILQELAAAENLKLERLTLTTMGQGSEALAHLSRLPNAEALRSLTIQHQTATGAAAAAIAAGLHVFPLRQLAVLAGQLTGTDLLGFAERNVQRSLRSLNLSENIFNDFDLLAAFTQERFEQVQSLQLRQCGLADASALFAAGFWPRLVELDLSGNRFPDAAVLEFLRVPKPPRLEALVLRGMAFEATTWAALRDHFGAAVLLDTDFEN